jgi:hypothetical protein
VRAGPGGPDIGRPRQGVRRRARLLRPSPFPPDRRRRRPPVSTTASPSSPPSPPPADRSGPGPDRPVLSGSPVEESP